MPGDLRGQAPYILWPAPGPISFGVPLGPAQLNARVLRGAPVPVPLGSSYNVNGINTVGRPFVEGFDGNGESFSSGSFGPTLQWRGITFAIGAEDELDAVTDSSIGLPSGKFGSIVILADLVNNAVPGRGTFTLHYTDGSSQELSVPLSDWVFPQNREQESVVACAGRRSQFDGTIDHNSACVYGYALPLDASRTVLSIGLPPTRNIVVLSMVLVPAEVEGRLEYAPAAGTVLPAASHTLTATFYPASAREPVLRATTQLRIDAPFAPVPTILSWPRPADIVVGTALSTQQRNAVARGEAQPVSVDLRPFARVNAIYADGALYRSSGFHEGWSFGQVALGSSLRYGGATFLLGEAGIPDAASSARIFVPAGNYTRLLLLAAAAGEAQLEQPFILRYSDGSSSSQALSLSAWNDPRQFSGETTVAATSTQNAPDGTTQTAPANLYGYALAADATRTLVAVDPPANERVVLFGLALDTGATFPVTGAYDYSPATGTLLNVGTHALHVRFDPEDAAVLLPGTASTVIRVVGAGPHLVSTTSLIALSSESVQGASIVLSAVVVGQQSLTPAGKVSFYNQAGLLGEAFLDNGQAQLTVGTLPVGEDSLLARYTGSELFLPSQSEALPHRTAARDFALARLPHADALATRMGNVASSAFRVTPLQVLYSSGVTFRVDEGLPYGTYATFSPATLRIDAGETNVAITLHTRKWSFLQRTSAGVGLLSTCALFCWPLFRKIRGTLIASCILSAGLLGTQGCGKGYAAHAYTFNVIATSGTVQHTLPLSLQILASPQ